MQIIQLVFYILVSIASCILLVGAIKEKAALVGPWLAVYIFHIIFSVINTVSELLDLIVVPEWVLGLDIATVIFYFWSFLLVHFFRKKLLEDAGSLTFVMG